MNGILLVDKPKDWTSHDVVAKIRNVLKKETGKKVKVGHTGTLDPFATGLMIVVAGSYTKRAGEFSKLGKTYEAELTLGSTSSTGDIEGAIKKFSGGEPSLDQVQKILESFVGEIEQTPHKFSAVKVGGQRAYKLARAGKEIKLQPRKVKVYSIQLTDYSYPKLKIVAEVSSGTYIRSLAEDIGQQLGTGAYLSALRRTKVSNFKVEDAKTIDELSKYEIIQLINRA